jgi:hypothetical protein
MASKKARELRKEFRENGFIVVESTQRKFKRAYGGVKLETIGREKMEVDTPKGASSKTHPHLYRMSIKQESVAHTKFKVVRGKNNLITIHRKNGSGLKLMRIYHWSGRKLHLLSHEGYMCKGFVSRAPEDLFRSDLPRLTHEQCVDIENVLIRL